jgi:TIR domain
MVIILYQHGCQKIAKSVVSDLRNAFANHIKVELIAATSASTWPADVAWDDLLIVMYNDKDYPDEADSFIRAYRKARSDSALLLPVAINLAVKRPPDAAADIKALEYDAAAKGRAGRLANRVGAMLGLRVQGRDSKIFISYRASDGKAIAKQLHSHFRSLGCNPFLDEAKEIDADTTILPGSPVQKQIDDALEKATLVLLLDTSSAPESRWIKHEIDTADSLLLPILPICFRDKHDSKKGPRFPSLLALQRWVQFQTPATTAKNPLSDVQLDEIVNEAEQYLCQIFQRKCRVPFIVEKEFVSRGFAWKVLDKRLLMFHSSKGINYRVKTHVLSHCSVFDPSYGPAMKRFAAFLKDAGQFNHSLFIYDGELLPPPVLQEIVQAQSDQGAIILHHQELAALIDSHFTYLGAA